MERDPVSIDVLEGSGSCALDSLLESWRPLWRRDPAATPFQHPAWLRAWWRHLRPGPLRALVLRRGGAVRGIVPMTREERPGGARWILLGSGTSDYLGGVFEPEDAGALAARALAWLAAELPPGEACAWFQLREDSPLAAIPAPEGLRDDAAESQPCPSVDLPASDDRYEETLSPRFARNLRVAWRHGMTDAGLRIEAATPDSAPAQFDTLARLHGAVWAGRGQPGVLADERVRRAHQESLPEMIADGSARLLALRHGARVAAVWYGLMDPPRARRGSYSYLGGFDPEAGSLSPGSLVIRRAIALSIREGCAFFDFLRGPERYKERWGARPRRTFARTLRRAPAATS